MVNLVWKKKGCSVNVKEQQDLATAMQNYAQQLVVEAYSRIPRDEEMLLSDEVIAGIVDAVEKRMLVAAKNAVESVQSCQPETNVNLHAGEKPE